MPRPPRQQKSSRALLFAALLAGLLAISAESTAKTPADLPTVALTQLTPLASGIILPVQITRSLRAGHVQVGAEIIAKTTQRVPVSPRLFLPSGAELLGEVKASSAGDGAKMPATLTLQFTTLRYQRQTVTIAVVAIAIANFTDVADAQLPLNAIGRGNSSPASWTTRQVGGDEVSRSGWIGEVINTQTQIVGFADYFGIYALPAVVSATSPLSLPRALGVFSASALGLYGFDEGSVLHSTAGDITVTRPAGKLLLHNGDNLLLEVL